MGWIANIFICIGLWKQGGKVWYAYLFTIVGEAIWAVISILKGQYDLAFICAVFAVLAIRNCYKWYSDA
jgi:hypothetical protein